MAQLALDPGENIVAEPDIPITDHPRSAGEADGLQMPQQGGIVGVQGWTGRRMVSAWRTTELGPPSAAARGSKEGSGCIVAPREVESAAQKMERVADQTAADLRSVRTASKRGEPQRWPACAISSTSRRRQAEAAAGAGD